MERKFRIEERADGPIASATWFTMHRDCNKQFVERHCRDHEIAWKKNLFRLIELKPIAVSFKTIVDFSEVN